MTSSGGPTPSFEDRLIWLPVVVSTMLVRPPAPAATIDATSTVFQPTTSALLEPAIEALNAGALTHVIDDSPRSSP